MPWPVLFPLILVLSELNRCQILTIDMYVHYNIQYDLSRPLTGGPKDLVQIIITDDKNMSHTLNPHKEAGQISHRCLNPST